MASPYTPVETILKVDENEVINGECNKLQSVPVSSSHVSIGTQCDWKIESPEMNSCSILSVNEKKEARITVINQDNLLIEDKNSEEVSMVLRGWSPHLHSNPTSDQKVLIPTTFSQQFACNIQTLPFDEKFFLQFDYKTRNKLKTKQRRLDPYYRSQERVRQRTVMRIKRQDPRFRAAEREKGRYRMRIKRLDPVFRTQERERQRERMKIKRSDPGFREREREQQKTRLHVKRLDPAFKEKERAQDRIRMHIKRQNNGLYSTMHSNITKSNSKNESICTENQTLKSSDSCDTNELQSNQAAFPDNINSRILSVKPKDSTVETFHFKKQHILNFNFYNSNKEQWAVHDELCSKTIAHFNVLGPPCITEDTINLLRRDHLPISRKSGINTESHSQELMDIKPVEMSFLEAPKGNNAIDSDSSSINRISLIPCSGGAVSIHEDTISLLRRDHSTITKKANINAETNSQALMNIKPVEMPYLETSKEKSSVNSDSSSINRMPLSSCTGK